MRRKRRPTLDGLLRFLGDQEWHSLDEMTARFDVSEGELLLVLRFFADYSFVEFEEERRRAKIAADVGD